MSEIIDIAPVDLAETSPEFQESQTDFGQVLEQQLKDKDITTGPLEKTFNTSIIEKLKQTGHNIDFIDIPHGGGQAIMIKPNNVLVGGSDPRKDGIALGY